MSKFEKVLIASVITLSISTGFLYPNSIYPAEISSLRVPLATNYERHEKAQQQASLQHTAEIKPDISSEELLPFSTIQLVLKRMTHGGSAYEIEVDMISMLQYIQLIKESVNGRLKERFGAFYKKFDYESKKLKDLINAPAKEIEVWMKDNEKLALQWESALHYNLRVFKEMKDEFDKLTDEISPGSLRPEGEEFIARERHLFEKSAAILQDGADLLNGMVKKEELNLNDIVEKQTTKYKKVFGIQFQGGAIPVIQANRRMIEGVIANILYNHNRIREHLALAKQEGMTRLWISTTLSEDGRYVIFEIKDNGPGFSKEMLNDTPYADGSYEVNSSFGKSYTKGGTGLGLAEAEYYIKLHKGRFHIVSRIEGEDRGSTFTITLPVSSSADDLQETRLASKEEMPEKVMASQKETRQLIELAKKAKNSAITKKDSISFNADSSEEGVKLLVLDGSIVLVLRETVDPLRPIQEVPWQEAKREVFILADPVSEISEETFNKTNDIKLNVQVPSRVVMKEMLDILYALDDPGVSIVSPGKMPEKFSESFSSDYIRRQYTRIHASIIGEIKKYLQGHSGINTLKILDVGASSGDLAIEIMKEFSNVDITCIDNDLQTVASLKDKGLKAFAEDARLLPYEDNAFDIVIVSGLLNQKVVAPEEFDTILAEVARVVKYRLIVTGLSPLIRDMKNPLASAKQRFSIAGLILSSQRLLRFSTLKELYIGDKITGYIEEAVRRNRVHLMQYWHEKKNRGGNPLSAKALAEGWLCGEAMADIRDLITLLAADNQEIKIGLRQAQAIFKGFDHAFIVLIYHGKNYLIDTTFMQFFDKSKELVDEITIEDYIAYTSSVVRLVYPWRILEQTNKQEWVALSHQLLKDGYIELTNKVADMYGNLLGGTFPASRTFTMEDLLQAQDGEYLSPEEVSEKLGDLDTRLQDLTAQDMMQVNNYLVEIGLQPGTINDRLKRQDIDTGL